MKKIYNIFILFFVLILLPSCGSNIDNADDNSYELSTIDTDILFGSHRLITENQTIFADLIKDNPIDKAYLSAKSDETTQGMMDIENEFADIWMDELEYSIESFTSLLNEEDKIKFNTIQEDWKKYISTNRTFLNDIFNNDEYQSYTGRIFLVEEASEYRNEIRKRVLYIKYLQFCMEQGDETIVEFKNRGTQGDGSLTNTGDGSLS